MKHLLPLLLPCLAILAYPSFAQPIEKMHNDDVRLKNLVKPYTPLPENFRTYQITAQVTPDVRLASLKEAAVLAFFRLEAFEKKDTNADLVISIKINKIQHSYQPRTYRDAQKQPWYYYEDRVTPQIQLELRDPQGRVLFSQNGGVANYHSTPHRRTQQEAAQDHASWQRGPSYGQFFEQAHRQTLQNWSDQLRNQYDQRAEVVSFYYPNGSDFAFAKSVRAIGETLMMLNKGVVLDTVRIALQPHIAHLEKTQTDCNRKTKKGWLLYAACALNLAHIYRCLEDYDHVQHYVLQLVEMGYYDAIPQIKHLSALKEHDKLYHYFKKNGKHLWAVEQALSDARFDSLQKRTEVEGYILLRNGLKLEGSVLDLVENFNNFKVKLKYEKKLNAPAADQEYPLADVKEMHLEGWHLGVMRRQTASGVDFCLTEIVLQSPAATLHRALPCFGKQNKNGVGQALFFLLEEGGKEDYKMHDGHGVDGWLDRWFIYHLKPCNIMIERLKCGYYTASQAQDVFMDYNTLCGNAYVVAAPSEPKVQAKSNPSRSPGFYWGISSGMNNFVSLIGLSSTVRLKGKLFMRAGIGTGTWGPRFAAGLKYDLRRDMRYTKGWSFAFGYGYNKGIKRAVPVEGSTTVAGNTKEFDVDIIQKPVSTLNASLIFNRMKKARRCFTLELGYAASLQKEPWTVAPGGIGAEHSKRYVKIIQPGGFIVGIGLNFGR